MYQVVCNFVQQQESHTTFVSAWLEIQSKLEAELTKRTVPYTEVKTGWYLIDVDTYISFEQASHRAYKNGLIQR